ncbi:MAG: hypothetical protein AAF456_23725 [Planctomycetota bacterium]
MRILTLLIVSLLVLVPSSARAQSTLYGYDIYEAGGLFSMSPSAGGSFAGFFRPGIGESVYTCFAMDFNVAGTEIFAIDDESGVFGRIDPATGSFFIVAAVSGDLDLNVETATGLTVDHSSGIVYVSTTDSLFSLDPVTGVCTGIGTFGAAGSESPDVVLDIAADNSGNLYIFDYDSSTAIDNGRLWSVDPSDAQSTLLGTSGVDSVNFAQGMDFDPATNVLYAAVFSNDNGAYGGEYGTWNTASGSFTPIESLQAVVDSEYEMTISGGDCYVLNFLDGNVLASFPVNLPSAYVVNYRSPAATPYAMDFNADGSELYAVDVSTGFPYTLGTVDMATGGVDRISDLSGDYVTTGASVPVGMTCDDTTGTFYLADVWNLYEVDVETGVTTLVGPFGIAGGLAVEIAASPAGDLYCLDSGTNGLYTVNKSTGAASSIGPSTTSVSAFIQGLDFDPRDGTLYCARFFAGPSSASGSYGIWDTTTGAFSQIMPLQSLPDPEGDGLQFKLAIQHIPAIVDVAPDTFDVVTGILRDGSIAQLLESDNDDISAARNGSSLQSRVIYDVESTSTSSAPSAVDFTIEESVFARGNVSRTIRMFNFDTGAFETVDVRNASRLGDRVDQISVSGIPGRFVENATNRVRVRIRYDGPVARANFTCNVDHIFWTITN